MNKDNKAISFQSSAHTLFPTSAASSRNRALRTIFLKSEIY